MLLIWTNDGDIDVLYGSSYYNNIVWMLNDGTGNFSTYQIIDSFAEKVYFVYAVDMDGDGDIDVLSAYALWSIDRLVWYENDGTGNYGTKHVVSN